MLWNLLSLKIGCVPTDAVARHAAAAAVEEAQPRRALASMRLVVAGEVAIERRVEDDLRALVGGERARQIVAVDGAAEDLAGTPS